MAKQKQFKFTAILERLDTGLKHHCIYVPPEVVEGLGMKRVLLTIDGKTWRRAIQGRKSGEKVIMIGQPILREIAARKGYELAITLKPDPAPDKVELGEEFEEVLAQDEEAAKRFYSFTPGKQRSLAYYVTSAKRVDTRIKRAIELAHKIKTKTLYSDRK